MTTEAAKNAQLVITQAAERLVQEVWQASSKVAGLEAANARLMMEAAAPKVSSRDLLNRISELENKVKTQDEFMKLKDTAKLRMDAQIREFKSDIRNLKEELAAASRYRDAQHAAIVELKEQNHAQAVAVQEADRKYRAHLELIAAYEERVKRYEEVFILGRKGLESEKPK